MKDDLTLIERLKNHDEAALSVLYDNYSAAMYGVIIRMCKNEENAQEILQETFIKAWDKFHLYDVDKGKLYTWLYRIARNTTLNFLRKEAKLIQTEELSVYTDKETEDQQPKELHEALSGAMATLDAHHQKALQLVYFKGLTHREAHEEMNVPLGTFKSYVRQAVQKLRTIYAKKFVIVILVLEFIR